MLSNLVVREVKRLLAAKMMSQREIANHCGVSRGIVRHISTGRRSEKEREPSDDGKLTWKPDGVPERCLGCGGMVYMPCRLCALRVRLESGGLSVSRRRISGKDSFLKVELGLELRPAEQRRYKKVRALREFCEAHDIEIQ